MNALDECHCFHLTHFAIIFTPTDVKNPTLEMTTLIACCVSLTCLLCVFLVAVVHRGWRNDVGHKLLVQMAINLFLLLTIFLAGDFIEKPSGSQICFFYGVLLHYAILANFVWNGVAGFLQYRRIATAVKNLNRPTKLVAKAAVIAWGLPVIPVVFNLALETVQENESVRDKYHFQVCSWQTCCWIGSGELNFKYFN
jgi:hypothetical protein